VSQKTKLALEERLDFPALDLYPYQYVRSVSDQATFKDWQWA
jgi:hypothetical protein